MAISKIYFVSAGPGDPKLLTIKAFEILKKSDAVFYAGSLINPKMLEVIKSDALLIDMKSLNFEQIKTGLEELLGSNYIISVLHAGDSSIYSSINEQMLYLEEKGIEYEIIPGVTAAFAASAAYKSILTLPDVSQTVIFCRGEGRTGKMPPGQDIKSLANHRATMAIYLSFGIIKSIVDDLTEYYPINTPCLIAKDVSLKGEILIGCKLKDVVKKSEEFSIKNMAILIIGEALKGKYLKENRSKLYDKNFSHGFRDKEDRS